MAKYEYEVEFTRRQSATITVESSKKLTEEQVLAEAQKAYEEDEEDLDWESDSLDREVASGELAE